MKHIGRADQREPWTIIGLISLGVLFRGTFFAPEQLLVAWILSASFMLRNSVRNPMAMAYSDSRGPLAGASYLDLAALGLPIIYLICALWSPSIHDAVQACLIASAAAMVYLMTRRIQNPLLFLERLAWGLSFASAIMVLAGLASYSGIVEIKGAITSDHRLASFFQYPDALAAFCIVGLLSVVGLTVGARNSLGPAIGATLSFLISIAFLLAASRGAFIVFPLAITLVIWASPREQAGRALWVMATAVVASLLCIEGFMANALIRDIVHASGWLSFGAALSVLAAYFWSLATRVLAKARRDRVMTGTFIATMILVGLGLALLVTRYMPGVDVSSAGNGPFRTLNKLLPDLLVSRVADMGSTSAAQRLVYYLDALGALLHHPLGMGSGSWPSTFGSIQRFFYVGRNVHSQLLQVAMDGGVAAFLAYLAFWTMFIRAIRHARARLFGRDRLILGATAASALALGLHGAIDFTLSYLVLYLIVWAVAGAISSVGPVLEAKTPRVLNIAIASEQRILWIVSIVSVVAIPFMFLSSIAAERGFDQLAAGSYAAARTSYATAVRFEPWSAPAHLGLAKAIVLQSIAQDQTEASVMEAVQHARSAAELDRALPDGYGTLSQAILKLPNVASVQEIREAVAAAEKAVAQQKYRPEYYPILGEAYVALAEATDDDTERAAVLAKLTGLSDLVAIRRAEVQKYERLFAYPQVAITPELALRIGQGFLLMGDFVSAEQYLTQARADRVLTIPSELWLYRIYQLTLDQAQLERLGKKPWILFSDQNPEFLRVKELTAKYEVEGGK